MVELTEAIDMETKSPKVKKTKVKKIKTPKSKNGVEKVKKDSDDSDLGEPVKKKKKSKVSTDSSSAVKPKKKKSKKADDSMNGNGSENGNGVEVETKVVDPNAPEVLGDFSKFRITPKTIQLLKSKGITYLFPIQIATFNHVYDGKDVVAQARTGTGKTMSFVLPIVEKMMTEPDRHTGWRRKPKVLVMCPTRELADQVHKDFACVSQRLETLVAYGGTPYNNQVRQLGKGVDIVVGTPGRIQDLINKNHLDLCEAEFIVLDEVDQMLDMGFEKDVDAILATAYSDRSQPPQTLLFSATCPPWVNKNAKKYMRASETVHVDTIGMGFNKTSTTVQHLAIRCHYSDRAGCMANCVQMYSGQHGRAMIFVETKREANELVVFEELARQKPQVLHGDIEQRQRNTTLQAFRDGSVRCLVATNVAARGLDIPEVDLVIQACPPKDYESYIHRSGRTGRAGRTGVCICFYKPNEERDLKFVENKAGIKFQIVGPPQPKDIVKSSINDTLQSLSTIKKKLVKQFMPHAEDMASKYEGGAMEALAAAIAWTSGAATLENRSLLSSKANFTTWHLTVENEPIQFNGFVYNQVERMLGHEAREQVSSMRLTADKMGAVFDLPDECTEVVEEYWKDSPWMSLKKCEELPTLTEQRSYGGGNSRGGYGGYNRRGGGGGWRGGNRGGGGFKRKRTW